MEKTAYRGAFFALFFGLLAAACGTTPEENLIAKHDAMSFPLEQQDFNQLGEPDLAAMARDPAYEDLAIYRVKVLPALATDQRIYRMHLFLPSGPSLWVARERENFKKKFDEAKRTLTPSETQAILDAVKTWGLLDANGRCKALEPRPGQPKAVDINGTTLVFEVAIQGHYRRSECQLGLGSTVEEVAKVFAAMNGDELVRD